MYGSFHTFFFKAVTHNFNGFGYQQLSHLLIVAM